jgi:hypothetical protein
MVFQRVRSSRTPLGRDRGSKLDGQDNQRLAAIGPDYQNVPIDHKCRSDLKDELAEGAALLLVDGGGAGATAGATRKALFHDGAPNTIFAKATTVSTPARRTWNPENESFRIVR